MRLSINQDTDNLFEVTDRNRKKIQQELIESVLKGEKEDEHVYSLKFYNSNRYEKFIPLKKKSNEPPPIKFKYRRNRLL